MIALMLIVGDHVQLHNAPIGDKGMSIWGLQVGAGLMLRHAVVKAALDNASK